MFSSRQDLLFSLSTFTHTCFYANGLWWNYHITLSTPLHGINSTSFYIPSNNREFWFLLKYECSLCDIMSLLHCIVSPVTVWSIPLYMCNAYTYLTTSHFCGMLCISSPTIIAEERRYHTVHTLLALDDKGGGWWVQLWLCVYTLCASGVVLSLSQFNYSYNC